MPRARRPLRPLAWLSLTLGALCFLLPRDAAACTACATDTDCPRGFTCEGFCAPGSCQADSDCSPGMRCLQDSETVCMGDVCNLMGTCSPVWQGGCTTDADCGTGYQCGAGGTICGPSGCTTTGICQTTLDVPCQADGDCPSCWSCTADPGTQCINPGGPIALPDAGATVDAGAPVLICRPPYWSLGAPYNDGAGPGAGAPPPTAACGSASGGGASGSNTTLTGAACALGAGGGAGSWLCFAAVAGAGLWGVGRRRGRRITRGAGLR
jgi:hypothetical protein